MHAHAKMSKRKSWLIDTRYNITKFLGEIEYAQVREYFRAETPFNLKSLHIGRTLQCEKYIKQKS